MAQSIAIFCNQEDSAHAGVDIGSPARAAFDGRATDAVLVCASAEHDSERELTALAHEARMTTMGFEDELQACAELLRPAPFVGCNTDGQVARVEGQVGGFHNRTAVVCVLPE